MASFTRSSIEIFFEKYLESRRDNIKELDSCIVFGAGYQPNPPITQFFSKIIRVDNNTNAKADLYCDIASLPLNSDSYDCVVIDQVLEHAKYPRRILEEAKRVLKKKGVILVATPYLVQIHRMPIDFWRFSPEALQFLLEEVDFKSVEVGSWGSKFLVLLHLYTYFIGGLPKIIAQWVSKFPGDDHRAPLMVYAGGQK